MPEDATDLPSPPPPPPATSPKAAKVAKNARPAPQSSVARFGVSYVGPRFRWAWLEEDEDGDYNVVDGEFRAHPGLGFDELLEYQLSLSKFQANAVVAMNNVETVVNVVAATPKGEDPMPALEALADKTAVGERERWDMLIEQVLILVAPNDREALRPHIVNANPADLRALKTHLSELVVERKPQLEVEAAGSVDPTSPESSSD